MGIVDSPAGKTQRSVHQPLIPCASSAGRAKKTPSNYDKPFHTPPGRPSANWRLMTGFRQASNRLSAIKLKLHSPTDVAHCTYRASRAGCKPVYCYRHQSSAESRTVERVPDVPARPVKPLLTVGDHVTAQISVRSFCSSGHGRSHVVDLQTISDQRGSDVKINYAFKRSLKCPECGAPGGGLLIEKAEAGGR